VAFERLASARARARIASVSVRSAGSAGKGRGPNSSVSSHATEEGSVGFSSAGEGTICPFKYGKAKLKMKRTENETEITPDKFFLP
jgi:hypothetical protein